MTVRYRTFHAMGSTCHVAVAGAPGLADRAVARVRALERLWSRFLPSSEVSRVNAARGRRVEVSDETLELFRRAEFARSSLAGFFDPVVLDRLVAVGYDRDHARLPRASAPPTAPRSATRPTGHAARPSPGPGFEIHGVTVLVRDGGFDPGGIGKGLAADLVAEELTAVGSDGCYVDLGGDIRLCGTPLTGTDWEVEVSHPFATRPACRLVVDPGGGGVATSSTVRRRWHHEGRDRHHLIDPRTGEPADTDLASVTVVAGATWWAEALAKAALIAGSQGAQEVLVGTGAVAVAFDLEGRRLDVDARDLSPEPSVKEHVSR